MCWKAQLHAICRLVVHLLSYSVVEYICLAIVLALLKNWHIQSINFVLVFPQEAVQTNIYIWTPQVPTILSNTRFAIPIR